MRDLRFGPELGINYIPAVKLESISDVKLKERQAHPWNLLKYWSIPIK